MEFSLKKLCLGFCISELSLLEFLLASVTMFAEATKICFTGGRLCCDFCVGGDFVFYLVANATSATDRSR